MSLISPVTLDLAAPTIVEALDYETILSALLADAVSRFAAAGVSYDVGNLETDPVKIILEAAAFRELLLRARVNDAAKANLLAFSTGSDLDHLAAFYGVERLEAETDARLRQRVLLAITGRSTAGPEAWYAYHAMAADVRIKEVRIYKIGGGPELGVAVLSSVSGGVPDSEMLTSVEAALNDTAVRGVNDVLDVHAATQITQNVTADIWLLPGSPYSVFEGLEAGLRAAWGEQSGIGFDLEPSWIYRHLHVAGVSRVAVAAPEATVVAAEPIAIEIGSVTLTYKGVSR